MKKYVCIHGHFYQPPRENPWLEEIEIQDSAHPYHDWNERITAECYAPNAASRVLNASHRITRIASTYPRISFDFGPTLLSWMEQFSPETYHAVLQADRRSMQWRSGHGNALAQAYHHLIMPLASSRDKRTQIVWGIRDFQHRFGRTPEGMWLPETAVDLETLDLLAELGIVFTIVAPHQALRIRKRRTGRWKDVSGGKIDPSRAYLCRLGQGKSISLLFFDGPISRAAAFEPVLDRGEDFAERLLAGFSPERTWPQLLHITTDGETYGHHRRFGDMALSSALDHLERTGLAALTNYGEYLALHPPLHEVEIIEHTSWSCPHGVERWKSDCGCSSGGHPHWNQQWRSPLREALDWLRDSLGFAYEHKAKEYLTDPWAARDDYIQVLLDRSPAVRDRFIAAHARRHLRDDERIIVNKLMEMQRNCLLMYTSCGWFFDEISGIETVQILKYAARAMQISDEVFRLHLEDAFRERLRRARSNIPELGDGARVYDTLVKPSVIDLKKVAAHYAVRSLIEEYDPKTKIFCYSVRQEDFQKAEMGKTRVVMGQVTVTSEITEESGRMAFCMYHLGDGLFSGGVTACADSEGYVAIKQKIAAAIEVSHLLELTSLMEKHFGPGSYSLKDLFTDEQRTILTRLTAHTVNAFVTAHRKLYDDHRLLMTALIERGMPLPRGFLASAECILTSDIEAALSSPAFDAALVKKLFTELQTWHISADPMTLGFLAGRRLETMMEAFAAAPGDTGLLLQVEQALAVVQSLPLDITYWRMQNIYYSVALSAYRVRLLQALTGDADSNRWVASFSSIGEMLSFDTLSVLPHE